MQRQQTSVFSCVCILVQSEFVCLFVCGVVSSRHRWVDYLIFFIFFPRPVLLTSSCRSHKCSLYSGKYFQKLIFLILFLSFFLKPCHWNANDNCHFSLHFVFVFSLFVFLNRRATKQNRTVKNLARNESNCQ